jgi:protein O-GlcNAc transferase
MHGANTAADLFKVGLTYQRQGRTAEAQAVYEQIVQLDPRHAAALHLLGTCVLAQGQSQRACDLIGRSLAVGPTAAAVHADFGNALHSAGRSEEALASYERALALDSRLLVAHFNRAVLLQQLDWQPQALAAYERVLELEPRLVDALFNRAVLLTTLQGDQAALAAYDLCLQVAPTHLETLNNRGIALMALRRPADALASFDAALRLEPKASKTLNNRGNALCQLRRFAEAVASFDLAIEADAQFPEAHRNRANALRQLGHTAPALADLEVALHLRPAHGETLLDQAHALIELKRYAEAKLCLTKVLAVAPGIDYARGLRLHAQGLACDWDSYSQEVSAVVSATRAGQHAAYPLPLLALTDSVAAQAHCARAFVSRQFPPAAQALWRGERYSHARIRVAYLSGDFRDHPVAALLAGVLAQHDRARFETVGVSLRPAEDSQLGTRIATAVEQFDDVSQLGDADAARVIREREADIVVDLMGFTRGARTGILAQRPAPTQINYLGFPGTMAASYIDYLIADAFVIPPESAQHYQEKIVWLPDAFQANDDQRFTPRALPSRRTLGLPEHGMVLCCFNNAYKINPACFDVWIRLLHAAPGSVLWLLAESAGAQQGLIHEAATRGIGAERLVFTDRIAYGEHLARLTQADLFLDTLPFNAGATASDALWAGVPILTCAGEAYAARMAGSLLTAAGLPELITFTLADYESLALRLIRTPALLSQLRARLAERRGSLALFDSARFCRHLESAYVTMWERQQRGAPAQSFAVPVLPGI